MSRFLEPIKTSSYERKVESILRLSNVGFEREKRFPDLHNGLYRFDFFLPGFNTALEVQGEQHNVFSKKFYKNRSDFLKAQERDRAKISYCLSHDIVLYCIPWWDMGNINCFADLLRPQYRALTIFHNDNAWREYQKNKE